MRGPLDWITARGHPGPSRVRIHRETRFFTEAGNPPRITRVLDVSLRNANPFAAPSLSFPVEAGCAKRRGRNRPDRQHRQGHRERLCSRSDPRTLPLRGQARLVALSRLRRLRGERPCAWRFVENELSRDTLHDCNFSKPDFRRNRLLNTDFRGERRRHAELVCPFRSRSSLCI